MEIRDHESLRIWNIKQLLDRVYAQSVALGNVILKDILDREGKENLAQVNRNRKL